jgi:putative transposase
MARQSRFYYNNSVYHVCIRGNNRQNILGKEEDKEMFLACLERFKTRFGFKLFGFVVMDNHAHLVIGTTSKINISKIMQAITLSYSVSFRKRYPYTGYVWQGRFVSNIIEDDSYILKCLEYIHNNPVRAGIVRRVEDYLWSSYNLYNAPKASRKPFVLADKFEV